MATKLTGDVNDAGFRAERARQAAHASNQGWGLVTRVLRAVDTLTPLQVEAMQHALDQHREAQR